MIDELDISEVVYHWQFASRDVLDHPSGQIVAAIASLLWLRYIVPIQFRLQSPDYRHTLPHQVADIEKVELADMRSVDIDTVLKKILKS